MEFKDRLNEYIELLECTAKELAESCGLSAATISRYRSGERIPEAGTENYEALIAGIVQIAENRKMPDVTATSVDASFSSLVKSSTVDPVNLQTNFNTLLTVLSISISDLSRFLNYDPSYVSRIKNGLRQPADPQEFASGIAHYVVRRYQRNEDKAMVADLIGCRADEIAQNDNYLTFLIQWLGNGTDHSRNYLTGFLGKLDEFNLNEYIRTIHFDELKVPSAPFQLPTSRSFFGLKEMMESELSFLKATVLSRSMEPVIMYSDMPMEEMAKDPEFPRKWMFGMAMMLKKGLHLHQIHNIDRSFGDMMLGLESWIPMYMTGQVSPYYLKGVQNHVFSHFLKVSGAAALTGEAINGYHSEGKYYLTKNRDEVAYYRKRAERLLSKASPLMEIYRQDYGQAYNAFLESDAKTEGSRHTILSSLPLHTASDDLIIRILSHNQVSDSEQLKIRQYIDMQRERAAEILSHDSITEEIPELTEDEFREFPMLLPLAGMFYEKDIFYTWQEYQEHLQLVKDYARQHPDYHVKQNPVSAFRNIQITIHEGKWVIVSKSKTPAIHFLIRHPKMRNAFENMVLPIIDK